MLAFRKFITEKYKNFLSKDSSKKSEYAEEVYELLNNAYAPIGGIKGSGFSSPQDMVKTIPFWKLGFDSGRLVAVVMYKDVGEGRKLVAVGSTRDAEGKKKLKEIFKQEFARSYAEISDPLLAWFNRAYPDLMKKYRMKVTDAVKIQPEITPIDDYFYSRKIGGSHHTKIMLGTIGKKIK